MNKIKKILIPILIIAMFFMCIPKTEYATNTTFKIGDITGDGAVDSRDTLRILEHIAASTIKKIKQNHSDWVLTGNKFKAADINEDGIIDSRDTLKELEYIAAKTIPTIAQKHPNWKTYIESKWSIEAAGIVLDTTKLSIEKGKTLQLKATVIPENTSNKVVTWSSSDTKVASVDGLGNVEGKNEGITIITVKTKNGNSAKCEVKITKKSSLASTQITTPQTKKIASLSITIKPTVVTYNGKVKTPEVTIKDGNTILKKGTNYTLTYSRNINAGIGIITITGKGNYTGTVAKKFIINKATYNMNTVKFANSTVTYDGKSHSILATGLPAGVKVSYIGNGKVQVGTYTIIARFTGNTTNYNRIPDRTATLKINAKPVTNYPENQTIKVKGKTLTKGQYANFRNVRAGKIGRNVLYRCINPILPYSNKQKEPAYYADQLLRAHNVKAILNLSDNINNMKKKGYSKSTYYKSLLNSGKVYVGYLKDNGSFDTKSKKQDIVNGLRFFVKNEGPYAIHCKWGQGRTGMVIMLLECLMDAPYDYIYNDFTTTFKNFKLVGKNTSSSSYNKEFSKYMKSITGKGAANTKSPKASDWKNVNLTKCAENYLKAGGMSNSEIQKLKNHLSRNY